MIPGQPIPTELDHAAERAALRRSAVSQAAMPAPVEAPPAAVPPPPTGPIPGPAVPEMAEAAPPAGAEPSVSPSPSGAEPAVPPLVLDPSMVGVVFIHGIGAQRAGETVIAWSAPIIRILSAWRRDRDMLADPVVRSQVDLTGRTTPFIELEVPADPAAPAERPRQRWVLTEAWWASDVESPGISDMLKWLIWRGEARRIGDGILTGINAADDASRAQSVGPSGTIEMAPRPELSTAVRLQRTIRDGFERVLIFGLFVLLALVAVPLYGLIKLLSALPIPTVVQSISTAQLDWFLADWFGDVRVLLGDRAQAANIRSRVVTAIDALREHGCSRIVVVGHSGGTIVGYMTLADLPPDLKVDAYITHGQALGLAWRLGHFTGPLETFEPADGDEDELLRRGDRLVGTLPPGLRWDDFWASHDPAPAGPLNDPENAVTVPFVSHLVTNRNSMVNDHGGYWDNEEGFVIPVMRLIDTAGRGDAESRFFPGYQPTDPRILARAERVTRLSRFWLLWLFLAVATFLAGFLAGPDGFPSFGAFVLGLPGSLATPPPPGDGLWAALVGAISIGILSYAVQKVALSRWDEWDAESRAYARHERFVQRPAGSLTGQWALLLVAQLLVAVIAAGSDARILLLAVYGGLLLAGWFPREWRRRVLPQAPIPPD
ncbi:MAG TPA: hypothetical protein VD763_05305 [Candidatus Saccharimonadales bacterium]|nr:hypothetical protein [Candidatus Saccharimonadales bacterium]